MAEKKDCETCLHKLEEIYNEPCRSCKASDVMYTNYQPDDDQDETDGETPPDELDREAATNIPDGENDWVIGSETFTRQEVFKLLYTQRAMISNDFKQCFCDDMIDEMYSFFNLPMRTPKF